MESFCESILLMLVFLKAPFLVTCLLICINNLLGYALCNISVYGDTITPFSNFDQASDLWQQVEMVSHLPGILNWGMEWVVDIDAVKIQLVSLDHRNNWVLST